MCSRTCRSTWWSQDACGGPWTDTSALHHLRPMTPRPAGDMSQIGVTTATRTVWLTASPGEPLRKHPGCRQEDSTVCRDKQCCWSSLYIPDSELTSLVATGGPHHFDSFIKKAHLSEMFSFYIKSHGRDFGKDGASEGVQKFLFPQNK